MHITRRVFSLLLALGTLFLAGCSGQSKMEEPSASKEVLPSRQAIPASASPSASSTPQPTEPETIEMDWSGYFGGMNGTAVLYDPAQNCYQIYHPDLANTRRSPCSTFKIVSGLIGLENHIISPDDSLKKWSGEQFWNADWNQDLCFEQAFRFSCVWYFRELIDEIGQAAIQSGLDALQYGNCDISDWSGHLNTNNNNPALTGFWIESSLKISPKEQTQVMERIFGNSSAYSSEALDELKQAMRIEQASEEIAIYGKTGMGKDNGVVVDAWFTGFADVSQRRVYFCVYLGESAGKDVSSKKAREIAIQLLGGFAEE